MYDTGVNHDRTVSDSRGTVWRWSVETWVLVGLLPTAVQGGADPVGDPHLFATVAVLGGRYVNVAIRSLGCLADRMLGRGTRS